MVDWLEEGWSEWMARFPELWTSEGKPNVPRLLDLAEVQLVEAVFCANLQILRRHRPRQGQWVLEQFS